MFLINKKALCGALFHSYLLTTDTINKPPGPAAGSCALLMGPGSIPGQEADPDTEGLTLSAAHKSGLNGRVALGRTSTVKPVTSNIIKSHDQTGRRGRCLLTHYLYIYKVHKIQEGGVEMGDGGLAIINK